MRLEAIEKYDPYAKILRIPKGTILSPEQVKTTESELKNVKRVREVLTDYFDQKAKIKDKKAHDLDICLEAKESFLRLKLYFFDQARKEKWQSVITKGLENVKRESRELRQQQIPTLNQWLGPFTI